MSVWQGRQGCAMHMQIMYALLSRRIENTEKHTLMLLHFIFFVMFLQAWKINTQNTHCGICGSKKLLFVFPWFLHDDDTVNYGFSCWQRDCGAQRERAINWWGICKQFTETMEQSGQLILTIPGLWPTTGASAPFLERGDRANIVFCLFFVLLCFRPQVSPLDWVGWECGWLFNYV